jgi:protein TonB
MRQARSPLTLVALLFASVGLHAGAFFALGVLPSSLFQRDEPAEIAIVVETPEPEPLPPPAPEELPPPPPPEPEAPAPPPRPAAAPRETPPPPDEPPPAPLEETPVAFDNVTLTNDGPSSFTIAPSSGISREGPIGPPGVATGRRVEGSPNGVPGGTGTGQAPAGPRIVAAADLSRGPRPPANADTILDRYFPQEEREQGIEGEAKVRVVLGPDGRATSVRVVTASRPAFGNACRRMFRDPEMLFTPPLDAQGNAVSTQFDFRCDFEMAF